MRKKSAKRSATEFKASVSALKAFVTAVLGARHTDAHVTWCHDLAIIRLYREFERLILNCLIAAINNDTAQLATTTGIDFPKHLTDEVCEYLIVGDGYFDFKGRAGLIQTLKAFVPSTHYLQTIICKPTYKDALERLSALRNFAAHDSAKSKKAALGAVGLDRMSSAGTWLKRQGRFNAIADKLNDLATEIHANAPY